MTTLEDLAAIVDQSATADEAYDRALDALLLLTEDEHDMLDDLVAEKFVREGKLATARRNP